MLSQGFLPDIELVEKNASYNIRHEKNKKKEKKKKKKKNQNSAKDRMTHFDNAHISVLEISIN